MKKIKLTQDKVALVDDEDYEELNRYKWILITSKVQGTYYVKNSAGITMHQYILRYPKSIVDHKDGNGLNNQRANIRLCTSQQNSRNRRKKKGCASIYKGVSRNKTGKEWRACIFFDHRKIHIGSFDYEKNAALAYNIMAEKLFGDFAKLNDIGGSK